MKKKEKEKEARAIIKQAYGSPADTDYTAAVYPARIQGHPTVNGLTHTKLGRQHSCDRPTDTHLNQNKPPRSCLYINKWWVYVYECVCILFIRLASE